MKDFLLSQQAKVYNRVYGRQLQEWASARYIGGNRWLTDTRDKFMQDEAAMIDYRRRLHKFVGMVGAPPEPLSDAERIVGHLNRGYQFLVGIYGHVITSALLQRLGSRILVTVSFWMDEVGVTCSKEQISKIQYTTSLAREILLTCINGQQEEGICWETHVDNYFNDLLDLLPFSTDDVKLFDEFVENDPRCKQPYNKARLN